MRLAARDRSACCDISGQWRAEFDTQVGQQKYLFIFQVNEGKVAGKATAEVGGQKREVEFKEAKLAGDTLTFVEMLSFQGNEVRIRYTGKVGTDEIAFKREVGDFAKEDFKATRVEATAANPAAGKASNAPAGERPRRGPGGFGGPVELEARRQTGLRRSAGRV